MHSAVMQNEKYIKFADKNSVEVIALGSLDKGIEAKDHRADTYEATVDGKKVELLVEFPNLTAEEVFALNSSKAGSYNNTGKIPYTSIVDPWTLEELQKWSGGIGSGTIQDAVLEARKKLTKEHGAGIERKALRDVQDAGNAARELAGKGDFAKAIEALKKVESLANDQQLLQERIEKARTDVVAAATAAVDGIDAMKADDPAKAKSELSKLMGKLRGTGLEDRAKELQAELVEAAKAGG
ncbi:MAG: hypothetical protein IPH13_10035 [Planctomycetes bacterium]|nr:hypothetical protein [Planctomycetota bacterium]